MNDRSESDRANVRFPPPLVCVLIILAGSGLEFVVPLVSVPSASSGLRWGVGGFMLATAVASLGVWPALLFRRSGQDLRPCTATPEILIKGPYAFTRNPMYLMWVVVCVGFAIILVSPWVLLLSPLCAVILYFTAIRHEEAYLEQKFGDSYRSYKQQVRRWM